MKVLFVFLLISLTVCTQTAIAIPRPGESVKGRKAKSPIEHQIFLSLRSGSVTFHEDRISDFDGISLQYQMNRPDKPVYFFPSFGLHTFYASTKMQSPYSPIYWEDTYKYRLVQISAAANVGVNIAKLVPDTEMPVEPYGFTGLAWFMTAQWREWEYADPWGYGHRSGVSSWFNFTQLAFVLGGGARYRLPNNPRLAIGLQLQYLDGFADLGLSTDSGDEVKTTFSSFQYGLTITFKPGH